MTNVLTFADPHSIFTISSKRLYDKCPLGWFFRYRLGIDKAEQSEALQRGIEFHADAEEAYTGGEPTTVTGLGYSEWVEDLEEFRAELVEHPFLVHLHDMYIYAGRTPPKFLPSDLYFGGVADLLGRHLEKNTLHIMDHKRVQRFYPYPYLYATEQLGLYQVAYELEGQKVEGVAISRVKVKEDVAAPHVENYINRYLKLKQGYSLSKENLGGAIKIYKDIYKDISSKVHIPSYVNRYSTSISSNIGAYNTGTKKTKVIQLREGKRPKAMLKSISMYSPDGYRVTSIHRKRGVLFHVERQFYTLSPEELRNIVRDFLLFVEEVNRPGQQFRRAPGIYPCPFEDLCRESRSSGNWPLDIDYVLADRPGYIERAPNQEVLEALKKGR